ncbi:DUF2029 domain-containing protein [Candidatus Woesearchaeota archaeon]|nr:DUF2029 domain-containing protein [Candidatus Woesearchaeota archaeon]
MVGLREVLLKNKFIIFLFLISTSFFIYQHSANFSWDFASYALNAQYWLGQGSYYEHYRPPLMPLIISVLSIFSWSVAGYLFITLVSLLFFYTSIKLADSLKINKELFYLFSLSPLVLLHGLINGTELLSLSLLELFLISSIKEKPYAGLFLGLAALTRYNFIIFIILIFINKDVKRIIKNSIFFILPFIPWFIYNYYKTKNFFTSFADLYAIGFKFREYISIQISLLDLIWLSGSLILLSIIGIILYIKNWRNKNSALILLIGILTLYQFYTTPLKVIRYLFPLALPLAYFSVVGMQSIRNKSQKLFLACLIIILLSYSSIMSSLSIGNSEEIYKNAISKLDELNIKHCKVSSNEWVMLNYLGKTTEIFPRKELLQKRIYEGNFIILFYKTPEPEWTRNKEFIKQFPVLYESTDFVILGKKGKCNPEGKVDKTYVELTSREVNEIYNYTINTNPCFTLFDKNSFVEKTCNFINFKGFKEDENRVYA